MAMIDLLTCPYCSYEHRDFAALEAHVQTRHSAAQDERSDEPRLNDSELAQLLAFEEAGLPSELALSDRATATRHSPTEEAARQPNGTPPSQHSKEEPWVECFCGERVLFREIDVHSDMHAQESVSEDDVGPATALESSTAPCNDRTGLQSITTSFSTSIPRSIRNYDQIRPKTPSKSEKRRAPSLKELFLGTPSPKRKVTSTALENSDGRTKRLGRAELGPHAHEKQMPGWLRRMLEDGAKVTITNKIGPGGTLVRVEAIANETPDLVPVLARLSELDRSVQRAFYCSPAVRHVVKMPREGGFCGYRNIQMMTSYIRDARSTGHDHFQGRLPSIIQLQDMIERAWDMGFNSAGKIETGGIKLTRKYIGTPEAQALFLSLNIPCEATAYTTTKDTEARDSMLYAVCEYFDDDAEDDRVVITDRPPIYFQHQGHSMTIVGVESRTIRHKEEEYTTNNLVVFDPMFNPSSAVKRLVDAVSFKCNDPLKLLKAYRRGESYLSKYRDFELLKLK